MVSLIVFLSGYLLTVFNIELTIATPVHQALGGVFALFFLSHLFISVVVIRYDWISAFFQLFKDTDRVFKLRFVQRFSGWLVAVSGGLVLLSGLDWFKVGTGRFVSFIGHVRYDFFLSVAIIIHSTVSLYFASKRRLRRVQVRSPEVNYGRREAIRLLGGMILSIIAVTYLDRIPRVSDTIDKIKERLPPGQYEVAKLRTLHVGEVPLFDPETWTLKIGGMVKNAMVFKYSELRALPSVVSESDFHCVTSWSRFNNIWEGVSFKKIIEMVEPEADVRNVVIICENIYSKAEDGSPRRSDLQYTTALRLSDLERYDVLLAYRLDGDELEPKHGWPLRLVVPHKYGYKSGKWVRELIFTSEYTLGYWESTGYSDTADPFTNDRYDDIGRRN
jgi:DMSO/TMAO reductase YedYZ molybdopterin-dependent catalytic subunit